MYANNAEAYAYQDEAGRREMEREEFSRRKTNPIPPNSGMRIKICTVLVVILLIAVLGVYVGFVVRDYTRDKKSPKIAVKTLNKELYPLEFPAITVCNVNDVPTFEFASCHVTVGYLNSTDPYTDVDCMSTSQYTSEWNGLYLSCWSVNMKGPNHKAPYKAYQADILNSIHISFNTDQVNLPIISVLLHKWDKMPNATQLLAPYTFATANDYIIMPVQQRDLKPLKKPKYTKYDTTPSRLSGYVNSTDIVVYFNDLKIRDQKEERSYKPVMLIGDIAAAFEILLGLSVFKAYLVIVAFFILWRQRKHGSSVKALDQEVVPQPQYLGNGRS